MKLLYIIILLLLLPLAIAETELEQGKLLVESKVDCSDLTEDQLEAIGEYTMEQLHPEQAHEEMHTILDLEEGTNAHKQFHVNLALTMYCQGGGMMAYNNMMGYGMMGYGSWNVFSFLYLLLLIGLVILAYLWIIKLYKSDKRNK